MQNKKLEELAKEFFENNAKPTEEDLYKFLVDNEWKIADNYDKACHREDIIFELEDREYKISAIPTKLIDDMLYYFEDKLGDYGSECGWRTILNNVIEWFEEDLEEYKWEEKE